MADLHKGELEGGELRYHGDTWRLTGDIAIKRDGERIDAEARRTGRARGDAGTLTFDLRDPPASLNPGNPGEFHAELTELDGHYYLVVVRRHATNHYRLDSMRPG